MRRQWFAKATTLDGIRFQCRALGLPDPVPEFRFHPTRRWRFDYAWLTAKVALEIDGGVFMAGGGRHSRGAGYRKDCEKMAEAAILGWRVIRCLPEHVTQGTAIGWVERAMGGKLAERDMVVGHHVAPLTKALRR